ILCFDFMTRHAPRSTLFPYTTLFRSVSACRPSLTRASGATAVDSTKVALRTIVMRTAAAPQVRSRERLELSALMVVSLTSVLDRSEEHTSELQSLRHLVCRLLLEKKK